MTDVGECSAAVAAKIDQMRRDHFLRFATADRMTCIVEIDGKFEVHQHTSDGIAPPSSYENKRKAAARVLQLLGCGPVAPQAWPEEVCVGSVDVA